MRWQGCHHRVCALRMEMEGEARCRADLADWLRVIEAAQAQGLEAEFAALFEETRQEIEARLSESLARQAVTATALTTM